MKVFAFALAYENGGLSFSEESDILSKPFGPVRNAAQEKRLKEILASSGKPAYNGE